MNANVRASAGAIASFARWSRTRRAGKLAFAAALVLATGATLLLATGANSANGAPAVGTGVSSSVRATTIPQVQHIVLIMQENHSFDNVLGKFCAEVDKGRITRPGYNTKCDGATKGTRSNGSVVTLAPAPDVVPGTNHSVAAQTADIDGGAMDGFDSKKGSCPTNDLDCYNQYDPLAGTCTSGTNTHATCIPYLSALATKYTVAGHVFELADAPSWGGHFYAAAATLDGFTGRNPTNTSSDSRSGQDGAAIRGG